MCRSGGPVELELERHPWRDGLWARLEPTWSGLLLDTGNASAFMSTRWLRAWMRTFGPSLRPEGLVWRDPAGTPVACALLVRSSARLGPFRTRRAYLNASGDGRVGCEHNDLLCLPHARDAVIASLVDALLADGVEELALQGFAVDTTEALRGAWPSRRAEGFVSESPYIDLRGVEPSPDGSLAACSPNTRSQIRRSRRRYETDFGPLDLQRPASREEAWSFFSELVELHTALWQGRGRGGAFSEPETLRFHEALVADDSGEPDGLEVDLVRIRAGSSTVGVLYNLVYRDRVSFYQSGFHYHEDNRLKPGLLAHVLAADDYRAAGRSEYDFLAGEPDAVRYKRSLSTDARALAWMQLQAPTLRMRAIGALRTARRRLRLARTVPRGGQAAS